jgi:hypothetical protein
VKSCASASLTPGDVRHCWGKCKELKMSDCIHCEIHDLLDSHLQAMRESGRAAEEWNQSAHV